MQRQAKQLQKFETFDPLRKFLFLTLGVARRCPPRKSKGLFLEEPEGVRTSRRNVIALSGALVLAGLAGVHPADLNVFGMKPGAGPRGVIVICAVVIAAQLYWYCLRHYHLKVDGKIVDYSGRGGQELVPINMVTADSFENKLANWISNWVAFLLTLSSWYFIYRWIVNA